MNPRKGDIVRILVKVCQIDLRGQLAVVGHQFDRHGVRWSQLEPWLESWPVDHVILQAEAIEVVSNTEEAAT